MKKYDIKVFTKNEDKAIPRDLVLLKNKNGWVFIWFDGAQCFTNVTHSWADCPDSDDPEAIMEIVKAFRLMQKEVKKEKNA